MFKTVLKFEAIKLFSRRNFKILFALFILFAVFCWDGISDYKTFLENKKPFQEMERDKVSLHIHYTFYGIRGVRLLFIPSPLSVIFSDLAVFPGMTAHVDTGEKLNISNSFKGKDLFSDSGGYMDFSGIMLLIGSFLALLYGYDGLRKQEYLKLLADISGHKKPAFLITLARVVLLNLVFWVLSGLSLLWLLLNGIDAVNIFFLYFVLGLTMVITFFVVTGAVICSLKKKSVQYIALPVVYFSLVLFIPWVLLEGVYMEAKEGLQSIYDFEYEAFKYVMDFERQSYNRFGVWKSGKPAPEDIKAMIESSRESVYQKLQNLESKRMDRILKRIRAYQTISALFPTTFYLSSNKELSSKGFQNFINFYRYAYGMKFKFVDFYLDRKFYRPLPKSGVEPFIKGNEDLFYGQSRLPASFLLGFGLTLLYIIAGLLFILYRDHAKVKASLQETKKPQIIFKKDENTLLVLCKNEQVKGDIFRFYKGLENTVCLDRINANFHFNSLQVKTVLQYFSRLAGVNRDKAVDYLSMLGITDLNTVNLSSDDILKIYAAVKIAADSTYIVFNDSFKMNSRQFEESFFKLLSSLEKTGKKLLYLSCEMPYPKDKDSLEKKINLKNFATFPLQFDKVTLR